MIDKQTFIKCISSLKDYEKYETSLSNLGINIWERDEVSNLLMCYIKLLSHAIEEKEPIDKYTPTDLEYFIYDTDFGRNCGSYYIEDNGKDVKWHNEEEFWEYMLDMKILDLNSKNLN